jgi:hypothetical protein
MDTKSTDNSDVPPLGYISAGTIYIRKETPLSLHKVFDPNGPLTLLILLLLLLLLFSSVTELPLSSMVLSSYELREGG